MASSTGERDAEVTLLKKKIGASFADEYSTITVRNNASLTIAIKEAIQCGLRKAKSNTAMW